MSQHSARLDRTAGPLLAPALLLLILVFVVPALFLLPISFRPYIPGTGIGTGWTTYNYVRSLADSYYLGIIARTLCLGVSVTAICLVVGYPVAMFLARSESRWRGPMTLLIVFPLLLNLVVRTFGWIALLSNNGLINQALRGLSVIDMPLHMLFHFSGLLIGMVHIYLPFMVLVLIGNIRTLPLDCEHASRTLGAGWWTTLWRVTLPLTMPGVLAGSILVFVLSISALVTPQLLGGPSYKVMATLIYSDFMQTLDWPAGSAMAYILTGMTIVMISVSALVAHRLGGGS